VILRAAAAIYHSIAARFFFQKGKPMAFDPTLPVNSSQVSSSELRNQFTGHKAIIDNKANAATNALNLAIEGTAQNPSVSVLAHSISNPPTQAQVLAIQNNLNELINSVTRAPA
jgi:hypothetical protein